MMWFIAHIWGIIFIIRTSQILQLSQKRWRCIVCVKGWLLLCSLCLLLLLFVRIIELHVIRRHQVVNFLRKISLAGLIVKVCSDYRGCSLWHHILSSGNDLSLSFNGALIAWFPRTASLSTHFEIGDLLTFFLESGAKVSSTHFISLVMSILVTIVLRISAIFNFVNIRYALISPVWA